MAQSNFFTGGDAVAVNLVNVKQVDSKPAATGFEDGNIIYDRTDGAFYEVRNSAWRKIGIASDSVASIAALKEITGTARDVIYLDAANRRGFFQWNETDLSTEVTNDPGEGVYVPPDSDSTGASGAWVRSYDGVLDVKWWGAVGDDSADDVVSIQNAINFASAQGLDTVFLPAGTYRVSDTVYLKRSVNLEGTGRYVSRFRATFTNADKAVLENGEAIDRAITLRHFGIIGDGKAGYGIRFGGPSGTLVFAHSNIIDVWVKSTTTAGVYNTASISNNFFGLEVETTSGYGLWERPASSDAVSAVNDNKYFGCRFSGNDNGGAFIDGTNRIPAKHVFSGCTFEANGTSGAPGFGVKTFKAASTRIENCWFEALSDEMEYGVHIDQITSDPSSANSAVIVSNTFRLMSVSAIRLDNVKNVLVGWNTSGSFSNDGTSANIYVDSSSENVQLLWNAGRFDGTSDRHIVDASGVATIIRPSDSRWRIPEGHAFYKKTTSSGTDYTVDLRKFAREEVSADSGNIVLVRGQEQLFENVVTDPITFNVKVLDNLRGATSTPLAGQVFLKVRVVAFLNHSNAGSFDIHEAEYHIRHKISATSSVTNGPNAAYESSATGQANESLSISISNVTQSGTTQTSSVDDHWVAFDTTISSGRSSPQLSVAIFVEAFAKP